MNSLTLIGLHGQRMSGKTTLARYLADARGYSVRSFAEPIKSLVRLGMTEALKPLLPQTNESLILDLEEKYKESFRPLWRLVGETLGRNQIDENLWVDRLFEDWDGSPTIVDDVRYPNEAQAILSRGGLVFSLDRIGLGPRDEGEASELLLPPDLITETIRYKSVYEGVQLLEYFIHEYHRSYWRNSNASYQTPVPIGQGE